MRPTTDAIFQTIRNAQQIVVITHVGPDGDALGSLTAVGCALHQLGKPFLLKCDDKVPERFRYLPFQDRVEPANKETCDLIISVDCGDEQRMGNSYLYLEEPRPAIINIDHHITNTLFGEINHIGAEAVSTTEILYDLFLDAGLTINKEMATALLTGLVTDTLGFRTVGTTAKTLKVAANLMEAGADLTLITMQGLNLKPYSTLQLWRFGLDNMRFEGGLIWSTISKEQRKDANFNGASSGGLTNMLADVDQAAMGAVLMEMEDGSIRVGFRCRPPYNVAELAFNLGGGGHALASGCTLDGPLDKAEALVVAMSKDAIRQQASSFRRG